MDRDALRELLDAHRAADPIEADDLARMRRLAAGDEPRPWRRDLYEPGHFTVSVWCLSPDARALLLIRHRRLGRWLQPGGHLEDADRDPAAAAARELREEAGIAPPIRGLVDVDIHRIPAAGREPAHLHHDLRFVAVADAGRATRAGDDAEDARWWPLDRLDEAGYATDPRHAARIAGVARRFR